MGELFSSTRAPLIVTDATTSETIKYASNAFLATKLSFVNALAGLCEEVGADARDVLLGLGYDKRIGFEFLRPGPGWGGSCLPKDTRALLHIASEAGYDFSLAGRRHRLQRRAAVAGGGQGGGGLRRFGRRGHGRRLGPDLQGQHRRPARLAEPADRPPPGRAGGDRPGLRPHGRRRAPSAPDLQGLHSASRPLRGGGRGPGRGGADRVGRVPLARLRPRAGRHGRARPSSTPATCSTRRPCAGWASATGGSGADEPGRGGRRRRLLGLAPVRPPGRAGRHGRLPRRPVDGVPGERGAPARPRPLQPRGDQRQREGRAARRRPRSTRCATWPRRPRRRPTWPAPSTPWPWGARAPAGCSSWPGSTRRGS